MIPACREWGHRVQNTYLKGLAITCAGVLILTPDALLIKLTGAMGPLEGAFLRSFFMALSWAVMLRIMRGGVVRPLLSMSKVGVIAAVLLTIDRYAFVAAVQTTTVANTLIFFAAVPAFTAVVAFFLLKERCGIVNGIAIAASLAGVAIICGSDLERDTLVGNGLAVVSALFYTFYIVCLRFAKRDEVLESLCLSGILGAVSALPFTDVSGLTPGSLAIVALQGLVLLPAGFALYFSGTRYLPAAEVALIGLLETVLAPVWAWAVIAETPTPRAMLGGAVVVFAILGQALYGLHLQRRSARPQHRAPAVPAASASGE